MVTRGELETVEPHNSLPGIAYGHGSERERESVCVCVRVTAA
jgi:hypothetical protein